MPSFLDRPPPFRPVVLGHDAKGQPLELTIKDFYTHVHVLGLSGKGKSRAIEYLLRQFLLNPTVEAA
jgi:DNA segregation ATPase FtsK/SpoIIIE-like protein